MRHGVRLLAGATASTVAGSNVTVQSLGPVPLSCTAWSGELPVFWTTTAKSWAEPAVALVLRRWSGVVSDIATCPVTSTESCAWADCVPDAALTTIGYVPAVTSVGGVAVTDSACVPRALTATLAAVAWPLGSTVTSQPEAPLGGEGERQLLRRVVRELRLNVNFWVDVPRRDGKSEVSWTVPPAAFVTWRSMAVWRVRSPPSR